MLLTLHPKVVAIATVLTAMEGDESLKFTDDDLKRFTYQVLSAPSPAGVPLRDVWALKDRSYDKYLLGDKEIISSGLIQVEFPKNSAKAQEVEAGLRAAIGNKADCRWLNSPVEGLFSLVDDQQNPVLHNGRPIMMTLESAVAIAQDSDPAAAAARFFESGFQQENKPQQAFREQLEENQREVRESTAFNLAKIDQSTKNQKPITDFARTVCKTNHCDGRLLLTFIDRSQNEGRDLLATIDPSHYRGLNLEQATLEDKVRVVAEALGQASLAYNNDPVLILLALAKGYPAADAVYQQVAAGHRPELEEDFVSEYKAIDEHLNLFPDPDLDFSVKIGPFGPVRRSSRDLSELPEATSASDMTGANARQAWSDNTFEELRGEIYGREIDYLLATKKLNQEWQPAQYGPQKELVTYDLPTLRREHKLYYLTPDDMKIKRPLHEAQALNAVRQKQAQRGATSTRYQTTADREIEAGTIKGLTMVGADPSWLIGAPSLAVKTVKGSGQAISRGSAAAFKMAKAGGSAVAQGGKELGQAGLAGLKFGGQTLEKTATVAISLAERGYKVVAPAVKAAENYSSQAITKIIDKSIDKAEAAFTNARQSIGQRVDDFINDLSRYKAQSEPLTEGATIGSAQPATTSTKSSLLTESPLADNKIFSTADDAGKQVGKADNFGTSDSNFGNVDITARKNLPDAVEQKAPREALEPLEIELKPNPVADQAKWHKMSQEELSNEFGPGWTPDFTASSIFKPSTGKVGRVSGDAIGRHPEEIAFAQELADMGNDVIWIVPKDNQKSADFFVNGVKMELKTSSNKVNLDVDSLSKTLAKDAYDARHQAKYIILDVRKQPGATLEVAQKAAKRAFGKNNTEKTMMEITIWTNEGKITVTPSWR